MTDSNIQSGDILLAEDSRSDAELTIRALRKNNILNAIVHLRDGKEVIDYLFGRGSYEGRDLRSQPKVILLDLKMPKINGIEVLAVIKADKATSSIPVVMLTSSKEPPDMEKCYTLGVNSYIVKPVAFPDFVKAISGLGFYWAVHNQTPTA